MSGTAGGNSLQGAEPEQKDGPDSCLTLLYQSCLGIIDTSVALKLA